MPLESDQSMLSSIFKSNDDFTAQTSEQTTIISLSQWYL
jgi:hypothetical protein